MNYKNLLLLLTIVIALCFNACGGSEKESPKLSEKQITQETSQSDSLKFFELDVAKLSGLEQGDTFELKTDEDDAYVLKIRRVDQPMPGLVTVSADIGDRETGFASIIIEDNKLSGSLELYKENKRFQLGYDIVVDKHFIKETTHEERDVLEGSEPLNPKNREN